MSQSRAVSKTRNQLPSALLFCSIWLCVSVFYFKVIGGRAFSLKTHCFKWWVRVDGRRETPRLYLYSWKVKTCAILWIYLIVLINNHSCSPQSVPGLILTAFTIWTHLTLLIDFTLMRLRDAIIISALQRKELKPNELQQLAKLS